MRDDEQAAAVDALRDFNFEAQAFREAVAEYFGVGVRETQASAHLVSRGQLSAGDLSRLLGLSPATITHLLGRLERAGLATVTADPADLRRNLIRPTGQARTLVEQVRDWLASSVAGLARDGTPPANVIAVLTGLREQLHTVRTSVQTTTGDRELR